MPRFFEIELFTLGGTPITLSTMVIGVILLVATWLVSQLLQRSMQRGLRRRGWIQEGSITAGQRLTHYVVMLVGAAVALETVGIDLAALFAAGAIFAVGLGFAMQSIAQNFVSGVILLVERSIKSGDILEVNGGVVQVERMGIRATLVRSRDDEELVVPNSVLVQSTVKNFTLHDSRFRVRATVGVTYSSDVALVQKTLVEAATALEWRNTAQEPRVFLTGFGNSSVDFEVSVWVNDPWEARSYLSQLNSAIWWALKEVGVTIAFPQLDVHFDEPVTSSLRSMSGRAA